MPVARPQTASLYTVTGERKYLTAPERTRFLVEAHRCERAALRTLCLTLAYTGCRVSEALALTPASIEIDAGFIAIRSLKKRSRVAVIREVPVPDRLLRDIARVHGIDRGDQQRRLWPLSRSQVWRLVKTVMTSAGISPGAHHTPKGLRHGFGIHAIRSGVPLNLVQRWLGHARMETTAIYLQAMGEEERAIAAQMWA
jgi:integrase/recombinase XerD